MGGTTFIGGCDLLDIHGGRIIPSVTAKATSRVQVLSTDAKIRQACSALPSDRYALSFSGDMEAFLHEVSVAPCDVAVIELALNGYAVCSELKSSGEGLCSVVMITERQHDRWLCLQAGADAVIVKPLPDPGVLVEAVESLSV